MQLVKLIAQDEADLTIVSAHCQDALLRVGDTVWQPARRRFSAALSRYDGQRDGTGERRLAALRFIHVSAVSFRGLELARPDALASLLAIEFLSAAEAPAGTVTLVFSGDGAIRLTVECIEATLADLGPAWLARRRPEHGKV